MKDEWKIAKLAAEVLDACRSRISYREERVSYWSAQKDEKLSMLKAMGISVKESFDQFSGKTVAANYSNAGQQNVRLLIDPDLERAVSEAQSKVNEHEGKLRRYRQWEDFLCASGGHLELDFDDYQFFFVD